MNRLVLASCVAASLGAASPALAMGALVTSPDGTSTAVSLRVATATSAGRLTRWGSIEVVGTATSFAWILPARPGARVDLASDAWLEALAATTTPRVVPPDVAPPCGIAGGEEVEGTFTHALTSAPDGVAVAGGRPALDAALVGWGMALSSEVAGAVDAALSGGSALVVLHFAPGSRDAITRTVRIVDDESSIPLGLVGAPDGPVDVTEYAFGEGASSLAPGPGLALDPLTLEWNSDGSSTYAEQSGALLTGQPGAWLFETAGHGLLFAASPVAGEDDVPSLVTTYFDRAARYGDATGQPGACAEHVAAMDASEATVGTACAPGALARVGDSACTEGGAGIDPAAFDCGGIADDLDLAFSGLTPGQVWVTRARSTVAPGTLGQDTVVGAATTSEESGPALVCSGYATPCPAPPPPSSSGASGGGGSGSVGGVSTGDDSTGSDPGAYVPVSVGTGDDGDDGDDDGSSGGGCGGDSSGDDSGSSCDGDSSDAGDGGGCDPSFDDDGCRVGRGRRGPASRVAFVLLALAAVTRRRRRAPAATETAAAARARDGTTR